MAARQWTEEQRKAQAEKLKQTKPWELSTGPKTTKGKKKAALNGRKNISPKNMNREDYIAVLKKINPELASNPENIELLLGNMTFKDSNSSICHEFEPVIRTMTIINGVVREVKRDIWTFKDLETARQKADIAIRKLMKGSTMMMEVAQQIHDTQKKLEEQAKATNSNALFPKFKAF